MNIKNDADRKKALGLLEKIQEQFQPLIDGDEEDHKDNLIGLKDNTPLRQLLQEKDTDDINPNQFIFRAKLVRGAMMCCCNPFLSINDIRNIVDMAASNIIGKNPGRFSSKFAFELSQEIVNREILIDLINEWSKLWGFKPPKWKVDPIF